MRKVLSPGFVEWNCKAVPLITVSLIKVPPLKEGMDLMLKIHCTYRLYHVDIPSLVWQLNGNWKEKASNKFHDTLFPSSAEEFPTHYLRNVLLLTYRYLFKKCVWQKVHQKQLFFSLTRLISFNVKWYWSFKK